MPIVLSETIPAWIADCVRNGMSLSSTAHVSIKRVTAHSNFNDVYRVTTDNTTIYIKAVPETPRNFNAKIPQSRAFAEAKAIQIFHKLVGTDLLVPELLFLDKDYYVLGMSDVGMNRRVLMDILDDNYMLLVQHAASFGRGLAAAHDGSKDCANIRNPAEDGIIRTVIFEGLLAPGANALFPGLWRDVKDSMSEHRECLIHCDLWAKNLLIGKDVAPALVDFEGALFGDPAFDIGTLLAVGLIPAIRNPNLANAFAVFSRNLIGAYQEKSNVNGLQSAACIRSYWYTGTFLAARGYGPFSYPMSDTARGHLAQLAKDITLNPPKNLDEFIDRVIAPNGAGQNSTYPSENRFHSGCDSP